MKRAYCMSAIIMIAAILSVFIIMIPAPAVAVVDVTVTRPNGGIYRSGQYLNIVVKLIGDTENEVKSRGFYFQLMYLPQNLPAYPQNYGVIDLWGRYHGNPIYVNPASVWYDENIGRYRGVFSWPVLVPMLSGAQNIDAYGWVLALTVHPSGFYPVEVSLGFNVYLMGEIPVPREEPVDGFDRAQCVEFDEYLDDPSPNPFNPVTNIRFGLQKPTGVFLSIYDIRGRLVRSFYRGEIVQAGDHSLSWDGMNENGARVVSGIYFMRFKAGVIEETKKLILMR